MKEIKVKNITIGSGLPKICVPIVETSSNAIKQKLSDFNRPDIDLIEWRMDYMENVHDVSAMLETAKFIQNTLPEKPLLATFRTKREGGEQELSLKDYFNLNLALAQSGYVNLVDLELLCTKDTEKLSSIIQALKENDTVVLLSNHDFQKTPKKEEIIQRLNNMQKMGADITKIAVMPTNAEDVLTLLHATYEVHTSASVPIVTMSMGKLGAVSRISGSTFGSAITFGALGQTSAPGQLAVKDLSMILHSLE